jgi:hypothetical protein
MAADDTSAGIIPPGPHAMGIGNLGNADLVFKKKFRWTFSVQLNCTGASGGTVPESFVKVAARPKLTTEEVEINFLNGVDWIPGKSKWETITVTYIDVASKDNGPLWNWLASVYDFTDDLKLHQGSQRSDYTGTGTLNLFDGCGNPLEGWVMHNMWPTSMDFGDLDYSSSDNCEISLTLRYSSVVYKSFCPNLTITSCCSPCSAIVLVLAAAQFQSHSSR